MGRCKWPDWLGDDSFDGSWPKCEGMPEEPVEWEGVPSGGGPPGGDGKVCQCDGRDAIVVQK